MKTVLARVVVGLAFLCASVLGTAQPAQANHGWHYTACCERPVWWMKITVYDAGTGVTWDPAWRYWIDYGIYGHNEFDVWGPIESEYAKVYYEHGLGYPTSPVYYDRWDRLGPVWVQGFSKGRIEFESNNLCRCYNWGGTLRIYYY